MAKKTYEYNNLTKPQQECLTLIESLGIYELRALARVFGDSSPTMMKRDDHITIVMDKIISGEDLKPIPLKQGRPYKELSNIEGILAELSQITGKDYTLKGTQQRSPLHHQKIVTFKQVEDTILKQKLFPIEVRGILIEKSDNDLFFINQDNGKSVLVKRDFDSRLKPYDYITGSAVVMNAEKEYILDQIKTINYQSAKTYKDVTSPYKDSVPSEKIKIGNAEITLGSRHLLNIAKFVDKFEATKKLISKLNENNIVTIGLIPNVMYEDFITIGSLGFKNSILLKYDESNLNIYETFNNMIKHISRLQEQGINIAIFVEDITTLANAIDFAFKNNTKALMGHTETTVDLIKNLIMLAKAGLNNKHTTLFTTFDQADLFDSMYVSSVYKVSKKIEL